MIMRAERLRIGNYVKCGTPEEYGMKPRVKLDEALFIRLINKEITVVEEKITTEWLRRFRFHKGEKGFYKGTYIYVHDPTGLVMVHRNPKNNPMCVTIEGIKHQFIRHVHQLQNVFYELTGEELKHV